MLAASIALLLFAAPRSSAPADPPLAVAVATCHRGEELALSVKTDAAIKTYEEAIIMFVRAATVSTSFEPLAACLTNLGAAWIAAGKNRQADITFKKAIALDPALQPDPHRYNPDVVSAYRRARDDLMRTPRGSLTVTGAPLGASVLLDGQRVGAVPVSIRDVLSGDHMLQVTQAGYEPFADPVSVVGGTAARREVFLVARETVTTPPPLATAASAPAAVMPAPADPRLAFAVAVLPFGGGQFAEHRPLVGALFAASEIALLAANVISAAVVLSDHRYPDGTFANGPRDRALQAVNLTALSALILTLAGGAVDGAFHRN